MTTGKHEYGTPLTDELVDRERSIEEVVKVVNGVPLQPGKHRAPETVKS